MVPVTFAALLVVALFVTEATAQGGAAATPPCEIGVSEQSYATSLGSSMLNVNLVTDPAPTSYQWIISLCNRTNKTPYFTLSCSSLLPNGTNTFYAAVWSAQNSSARSPCLAAFDAVESTGASFAAGGYVNITLKSTVTGARLTVATGCPVPTTDTFSFNAPETGSFSSGQSAVMSASSSLFCTSATPAPPTPPPTPSGNSSGPTPPTSPSTTPTPVTVTQGPNISGGGDSGVPGWGIAIIVVLGAAVVGVGAFVIYLCCRKRELQERTETSIKPI